jgi:hypothetical protein
VPWRLRESQQLDRTNAEVLARRNCPSASTFPRLRGCPVPFGINPRSRFIRIPLLEVSFGSLGQSGRGLPHSITLRVGPPGFGVRQASGAFFRHQPSVFLVKINRGSSCLVYRAILPFWPFWSDQKKRLSGITLEWIGGSKNDAWLAFEPRFLSCISGQWLVIARVARFSGLKRSP